MKHVCAKSLPFLIMSTHCMFRQYMDGVSLIDSPFYPAETRFKLTFDVFQVLNLTSEVWIGFT